MRHENLWIRVAGNAEKIRNADDMRWRCFLEAKGLEIPIRQWRIAGEVTNKNFIPGTNPKRDHLGLVAWIDIFGSISVSLAGDVEISVQEPDSPPPGGQG